MNERQKQKMQRNEAMGKKIWEVLTPFGIMILSLLIATMVGLFVASTIQTRVLGGANLEIDALMDRFPVISMLVSIGFYLLALCLLKKGFSFDQIRFAKTKERWKTGQIILGILLLSCIGHLWSSALYGMHITDIFKASTIGAAASFENQNPLLLVLATVLLGPFTEEVAFRGMVYTRAKDCYGRGWGVFISALLFGVYHLNMIQFLYAFVIGIVAAMLYEDSDTLLAPVLAHMGLNLWALTNDKVEELLDQVMGNGHVLLCVIEAVMAFALLIVLLKIQKQPKENG